MKDVLEISHGFSNFILVYSVLMFSIYYYAIVRFWSLFEDEDDDRAPGSAWPLQPTTKLSDQNQPRPVGRSMQEPTMVVHADVHHRQDSFGSSSRSRNSNPPTNQHQPAASALQSPTFMRADEYESYMMNVRRQQVLSVDTSGSPTNRNSISELICLSNQNESEYSPDSEPNAGVTFRYRQLAASAPAGPTVARVEVYQSHYEDGPPLDLSPIQSISSSLQNLNTNMCSASIINEKTSSNSKEISRTVSAGDKSSKKWIIAQELMEQYQATDSSQTSFTSVSSLPTAEPASLPNMHRLPHTSETLPLEQNTLSDVSSVAVSEAAQHLPNKNLLPHEPSDIYAYYQWFCTNPPRVPNVRTTTSLSPHEHIVNTYQYFKNLQSHTGNTATSTTLALPRNLQEPHFRAYYTFFVWLQQNPLIDQPTARNPTACTLDTVQLPPTGSQLDFVMKFYFIRWLEVDPLTNLSVTQYQFEDIHYAAAKCPVKCPCLRHGPHTRFKYVFWYYRSMPYPDLSTIHWIPTCFFPCPCAMHPPWNVAIMTEARRQASMLRLDIHVFRPIEQQKTS